MRSSDREIRNRTDRMLRRSKYQEIVEDPETSPEDREFYTELLRLTEELPRRSVYTYVKGGMNDGKNI